LTPEAYDDPNPNGRHRHPGLDADLSMASRYEQPPAPKPSIYEEPEAHEPQMAPVDLGPFAPPDHDDVPMPVSSNVPASSRNTFIEAARRAAQKQPAAARPVADSNSLIGRALARFQTSGAAATPEAAPRALAGDKPSRTEWKPEPPPIPVGADAPVAVNVTSNDLHAEPHEDHDDHKPSFLVRNRRLLLLAAILGAFGLLTFNLLMHRASSDPAPLNPGEDLVTNSIVEAGTLDPVPLQDMPVEIGGPRVIEMVDSLKTGSIDPSAAQGFAATPQAVPPALVAANALATDDTTAIAPLADPSAPPKTFELPPEGLGPIELRQAAGNGDPRAQFEIAAIYTEGRSVRQDYAAAATWYERAANQGFAPAQYRLGSLYEGGEGVDKDLNLARLWYERAAASGNRMSMHNLAALYAGGGLGKQEFDQAAKWFELAADHGLTDSQFNLGMLYARGLGVTQSLEQSFKWFGIAALSGDKDAAKARDDIARSLDADSMSRLTAEVAAFRAQSIDLKANFAPIGTWNAGFDPGETITAKDLVASVQGALSRLGYDIGVPDGVFGPKTAEAIKAFERGTGMSESGLINPRLLAVLGSQPV
ncbi:MAG: peptidoglycan-binding protein, partial [Devosia sp.]